MKGYTNKKCIKCGVTRPLGDFRYTNKAHVSRRSSCKTCEYAYKMTDEYKEKEAKRNKRKRKDEAYRLKQVGMVNRYGMTTRGRANRLYHGAKHRAKTLGLQFEITPELIECWLIIGICVKTGIPFDLSAPKNGFNFNPYAPSLDRKNPFEGYTNNNVQVVCNAYNLAKNQFSDEQFISFCKLVVNYNVQ